MQYPKASLRPVHILLITLLLAFTIPITSFAKEPFATLEVDDSIVTWHPRMAADGFRLLVSGPEGVLEAEFDSQPFLAISGAKGVPLPDGVYSYELWARGGDNARSQWGYLTVAEGRFLQPVAHKIEQQVPGDKAYYGENLYVEAHLCVGVDCIDEQSLPDTVLLKEGDVSIKFEDTSTGSGIPTNDWELTVNADSANKVSLVDVDNGETPFTIEAAAPDHALYVDSTGNIGFSTISPQKNLHVISSSVPTVRLEYTSSGTPLSKWDVSGDDSAFIVSDVTGTATEPFSIGAGAPSDSMVIDAAGEVGLGTDTPDAELHVVGAVRISETDDDTGAPAELLDIRSDDDNSARIRFDDGDAWNAGGGDGDTFIISEAGDAVEFEITSSGNVRTSGNFTTTQVFLSDGNDWLINVNSGNNLILSEVGDAAELEVKNNGDVVIAGTLTENSDVNVKENFAAIDPQQVLALATELPLITWTYKDDEDHARHLGPMAQDFHAAFGLGRSDKGIAPRNLAAVTLAALQGLNQVVESVESENAELRQQNAELLQRLEALEAASRER